MPAGSGQPELGFVHEFRPASSPHAPVLLCLHGTGGDERQLLDLGSALAPHAALLAPRGPVLEGDGVPRFFRRIPTGGPGAYPFTFDSAEVTERAGELADFVDAARARYELGDGPVLAVGFSNGANIAGALTLTRPGVLRGGVLAAPMPVLDDPPRTDLSTTALLLAGGRRDPVATPQHVETLAGQLSERGASVEVHWHDGGHELAPSTVEAARRWLDKLSAATGGDGVP